MAKKRSMTKQEKAYVDLAVSGGCIIEGCGQPAEWHHLPGARIVGALAMGYPVCAEHHRGQEFPGQSVHSSRLLFTQQYGDELVLAQKTMLRMR